MAKQTEPQFSIWGFFVDILCFIPGISAEWTFNSDNILLKFIGLGGLLFSFVAIFAGGLVLIYGFAIFMLHDDWGFLATLGFLFMGE